MKNVKEAHLSIGINARRTHHVGMCCFCIDCLLCAVACTINIQQHLPTRPSRTYPHRNAVESAQRAGVAGGGAHALLPM